MKRIQVNIIESPGYDDKTTSGSKGSDQEIKGFEERGTTI